MTGKTRARNRLLEGASRSKQVALFPEDREAPELDCEVEQVRLA